MSNIGKSEVNTSYSRNDECSVGGSGKKCELTDNIVTVNSNGKQDVYHRSRCCAQYSMNVSNAVPEVKLSACDLADKDPDFLINTIKELQKKIEYTEKMNWLCKLHALHVLIIYFS